MGARHEIEREQCHYKEKVPRPEDIGKLKFFENIVAFDAVARDIVHLAGKSLLGDERAHKSEERDQHD
ncbi:hypothetical protein HRbin07_00359 [bacterium HR07]|nr:hypothetical protein HRbin07_00359 [bacterium HR07]